MKSLRNPDKNCHDLADIQARLFKKSALEKIPSFYFIKVFMHSEMVKKMDEVDSFLYGNISEQEIYMDVVRKIKNINRGEVYSASIMNWIGYFYRTMSFMTSLSSKRIFELVKPKYLCGVYPMYHSLDITKAVQMVMDDLKIILEDDNQRFMRIFQESLN